MRRLLFLLTMSLAAVISSSTVALAASTASAQQHPVGGSGINGDILFVDDPVAHTLTVDGTATGLKPNVGYFSLVYTNGTHPGGIAEGTTVPGVATPACNDFNKSGTSSIDPVQMVVGQWTNHNNGTGTIHAVKSMTGNSQAASWFSTPVTIIPPTGPPAITLPLGVLLTFFGYNYSSSSYTPIGTFPTVSIRSEEDPSNFFALVACGEVH
jgi:hypothetical protein